ncbi:MAG: hypothetical protein COW00_08995 [Bdellovibrio sp. CG12_big_fil_rev_8_21_14_0_65_39_13]|nr:MAG: hypothetical protein COW78_09065 [Bdellovibrio sp. CG22_combo_CG10-13_8_21_14_all_39_27]PIQ59761.1 MAG: hypothetical protein COW00_08995 [Bdellovibrio sp. CG12_big_fil_rev_8_21_14_0_65_39_13]PIR36209.1 MAG: hypothetical protein COV37_04390 [Bdellovibrio sp. CG11_big_fil_rev_8_21_14_0_20_39_38]PJB54381.1 MAG: hypothetical protein CO099_01890 [Bdellovibrio sp. CG_4_9_14_3_um_filter_39_7]
MDTFSTEFPFTQFQIEGSKRVTLFAKTLGPQEAKTKIVILHDLLDYHRCYIELGTSLYKKFGKDSQIIWIDLRGHGLSTGNRFTCSSFDDYCLDTIEVLNQLTSDQDHVVLLGQGLGGLVSLRIVQNHFQRLKAIPSHMILSNPLLRLKMEPPIFGRTMMEHIAGAFGKVFMPIDFEARMLTHNPQKSEIFAKDPLIGKRITYGLYQEILRISHHVRQEVYYINIPCMLLIGNKDQIADSETTKLFAKGLMEGNSFTKTYQDGEHDLFNDICHDDSLDQLYDWIKGKNHENLSL